MFDCAQFYENESNIGEVLSKVNRSEIFIISKVWGSTIFEGKEEVKQQCYKTINNLQCTYLDLYLVHWYAKYSSSLLYIKDTPVNTFITLSQSYYNFIISKKSFTQKISLFFLGEGG